MKSQMIEALELCQKALSMMITPAQIDQTSTLQAFAIATEAEAKARAALSVPAAAVVGEPVEWHRCKSFMHHFVLGSERPQNNTSNPNEWTPLYAAPSAPEGWQPIETAPKDGTKILAWSGFWDKHHLVRWNQGENAWCEGSWCFGSVPDMVWMPLPAPPALGGSHD